MPRPRLRCGSAVSRGAETREAIFAQPDWLRGVPARVGSRRLPQVRVVFAGCGTSFHAAQTGGEAVQALDLVHERLERADVFVLVSHEGQTPLTLEVAKSYPEVEKWLVTGAVESPLAEFCDEVVEAVGVHLLGRPGEDQCPIRCLLVRV